MHFRWNPDSLLTLSAALAENLFRTTSSMLWIQYAIVKSNWVNCEANIEENNKGTKLGKSLHQLAGIRDFFGSNFLLLTVAGVFRLRIKRPDVARPYRTLGYPVILALYLLAASAILIIALHLSASHDLARISD